MLDRRSFLAIPLATALSSVGTGPEPPPREFHRFHYDTDSWERITRYDIRPGDVLRVFDPPKGSGVDVVVLVSRVEPEEFYATHEIDPATNRWVEAGR